MSVLIDIGIIVVFAAVAVAFTRWYVRERRRDRARSNAALLALQPENLLTAVVRGDSIPAMQESALERARELYGPGARLRVESVGDVTAFSSGRFRAIVRVRNYPPAAQKAATA